LGAALAAPAFAGAGDAAQATFARLAAEASATLENAWFAGSGWRECLDGCHVASADWGADSLSYALYLRWKTARDARAPALASALLARLPRYGPACRTSSCGQWSDVPMWDAIAALRLGEVADQSGLGIELARRAFATVDATRAYARGACPQISYQRPFGRRGGLKTLETDSNYVKAALLLYRATGEHIYFDKAAERYAAIRRHFFESPRALYTVYVFDDGAHCTPLPGRAFASVNGNMIWNGLELAARSGDATYRAQALATARSVVKNLSDGAGIFEDLQAENDIVEPLVEAMLRLAQEEDAAFARAWIMRNARSAALARRPDGSFGRFFGGPVPPGQVTAWQTNGGFALATAAAALLPDGDLGGARPHETRYVALGSGGLGTRLRVRGDAVALIGTLGERCCEPGHARVFIDGRETFDRTGIWQNKSSSGRALPQTILFAWRWNGDGTHVLEFRPGALNAKEGGAFLHLRGYAVEALESKGAPASPANPDGNSFRHD
jgi:hypothetical protein